MFKIGEFSAIARVSDVLLRHYDDLDLFKPAQVDPTNGYRYYTIEQLPALNRILVLRDLGLSLPQIGRLVADGITAEEIQGMLRLQAVEIEETIVAEQSRLRRLRTRLKYVQNEGVSPEYEVVLKSVPEQSFLSLRQRLAVLGEAGQLYYEVGEAVQGKRIKGLSHCVGLFHEPAFRDEQVDWEIGILLKEGLPKRYGGVVPLREGRVLTMGRLPAVKEMATAVHIGPWAGMHQAFAAVGNWMAQNGAHLAGPVREVYLNLVPPGEDEDFAVEVQLPVG